MLWKLTYSTTSKAASHLFMYFPQYLLTLKHHNTIHHLLTAGQISRLELVAMLDAG